MDTAALDALLATHTSSLEEEATILSQAHDLIHQALNSTAPGRN
ncbi:MAG: hypothetical protein Q3972_05365 [Corynebacterium sp.]|nr:hypothetical protein [Corynebacterium sp.]